MVLAVQVVGPCQNVPQEIPMKFPERPTCHDNDMQMPGTEVAWESCNPTREDAWVTWKGEHRVCNYCGSMHPEDLIKHFETVGVAELTGADWKYGWPHKFAVLGVPNLLVGEQIITSKGPGDKVTMGPASSECHVKWYNAHIGDEGYDDEAREALLAALSHSGITWYLEEGKIMYKAPRGGYQRWSNAAREAHEARLAAHAES